jgi:hypothetical protein
MDMRVFKNADEAIDFETAGKIANEHGYNAERLSG